MKAISSIILVATVFTQSCSPCTDTVYVGYAGSGFSVSKDGGQTWTKKQGVLQDQLEAESIAASGKNVYVGTNYGLYLSHDGGETWKWVEPNEGEGMKVIPSIFIAKGRVYLVLKQVYSWNRFLVSQDNGETWPINSLFKSDDYFRTTSVYFNEGKSYVGMSALRNGRRGLEVSQDDGKTWKSIFAEDVTAISGTGNKLYLGLGGDGARVAISEDEGKTWKTQNTTPLGLNNPVTSVVASQDKIYVASYGGGVSISSDGGKTWLNKMVPDGLANNTVNSMSVSGNNVYATAWNGLSISRDSGNTWTKVQIGIGNQEDKEVYAVFAQCI